MFLAAHHELKEFEYLSWIELWAKTQRLHGLSFGDHQITSSSRSPGNGRRVWLHPSARSLAFELGSCRYWSSLKYTGLAANQIRRDD
jgi:hypothetical protein